MPPRGRYGDGSWTRLPSGKYLLRFWVGQDAAGKPLRRSVSGVTLKECRDKRDAVLGRRRAGSRAAVREERQPLAAFLADWLESKRGTVVYSTLERYRMAVDLHLVPHLGGIRLVELTPNDVRRAYRALEAGGLGPRSVDYAHVTLKQALKRAVKDGVLARNVCDAVDAPKVPRTEARALSTDEVQALLGQAAGDWHTLWLVALYSGMRLGELLGLAWADVDLTVGRLTVQRALVLAKGAPELRPYPKSRAGIRVIAIPEEVVQALKEHRTRQRTEQVGASVWADRAGLVFLSNRGTPLLESNVIRIFKRDAKRAGIPGTVGLHTCRHSFASVLLREGRPVPEVSYLLGHSSAALTMTTYAHYLPTQGGEAPAALSRAYGAPRA